jgi:hypothetical protein
MPFTLTEAATATGKARSTIFKACKSGKISYEKDAHGEILIEPAELHRVYPPISKNVEVRDRLSRTAPALEEPRFGRSPRHLYSGPRSGEGSARGNCRR